MRQVRPVHPSAETLDGSLEHRTPRIGNPSGGAEFAAHHDPHLRRNRIANPTIGQPLPTT
eukprot:4392881-Pyramimonas_sp.AAC.1